MSASLAAMLQRIPLWHMRCLMSVLQAASVTPLPWAALSEGGGGGAEVFHRVVEVEQVLVAAPGEVALQVFRAIAETHHVGFGIGAAQSRQ